MSFQRQSHSAVRFQRPSRSTIIYERARMFFQPCTTITTSMPDGTVVTGMSTRIHKSTYIQDLEMSTQSYTK